LAVLGLSLSAHADSEEGTLQVWVDYVDEYRQYMEEYRQWASDRFGYYESQIRELTAQLDSKHARIQGLEEAQNQTTKLIDQLNEKHARIQDLEEVVSTAKEAVSTDSFYHMDTDPDTPSIQDLEEAVSTDSFRHPDMESEVTGYQPDLDVVIQHDFRTYWKENFDFQIIAFDTNKTPQMIDKDTFDGRLDGANVTATISMDANIIQSYGGITRSGEFADSHYFEENISAPGEYALDVAVDYLDQTVSESVPFFVIGTVQDNKPRDTDNDGTPDHRDDDDDNDDIPDEYDECPLEAEDTDNVDDNDGCPDP